MVSADVVIAHAGCGSLLSALAAGRCPVLVPRRTAHGENVDEHQGGFALEVERRRLAVTRTPEELTLEDIERAGGLRAHERPPAGFELSVGRRPVLRPRPRGSSCAATCSSVSSASGAPTSWTVVGQAVGADPGRHRDRRLAGDVEQAGVGREVDRALEARRPGRSRRRRSDRGGRSASAGVSRTSIVRPQRDHPARDALQHRDRAEVLGRRGGRRALEHRPRQRLDLVRPGRAAREQLRVARSRARRAPRTPSGRAAASPAPGSPASTSSTWWPRPASASAIVAHGGERLGRPAARRAG